MTGNPVVELARDPVRTLTLMAYALTLVTLSASALAFAWRWGVTAWVQAEAQRPQRWDVIPPAPWLARLAGVGLLVAAALLMLAGVPWVVGNV